ncbi:MAG TPA: cysteine peptidase family C39 domain-containing protein [Gemmatimonadales bacterium]|nr:cysteine peptidase family C39 domain-containing protein [Gemmatimonadales bacterium]
MSPVALRRGARVLAGLTGLLLVLTVLPSALRLTVGGIRFSDYPPREAVYLGPGDVVPQQSDADCGLAALLTLLRRNAIPATYGELTARLPVEERVVRGITFRALAGLAGAFGLPLDGYRLVGLSEAPATVPWIAHLQGAALGHYVVVDRITARAVIVSDPAWGQFELPRAAFERLWSGYALVRRQELRRWPSSD